MRIALDAMGGDYAPKNTIEGAVPALKEYPYIEKLFLVGDAVATGNELKRLDFKDAQIEIFHASEVVSMKESAAKAVRHRKDASICRAVDLVKNGSAHAVVSAGHTGAALVACVLKLRTLKGIDRPAIACLLPTQNKVFVLIDGGANPDSNPGNLVQFAIMGSAFSTHVPGYNNPSVALMSIGEEDMRGNDVTKEAFKLLKASGLNFRGNIEGHDLFEKPAEVVVCDGFTGNVVLKTTEAVAHAILSWLKLELFRNPVRTHTCPVNGEERVRSYREREIPGVWRLRLMRAVMVRLPGLSLILATRELPYERRPPRNLLLSEYCRLAAGTQRWALATRSRRRASPHDPLLGEPH